MNLVDTSGWLEYIFDEENADFFAQAIEDTERLLVSVINIYEVFKKVVLVTDQAVAFQIIAQMRQGKIVNLTEEISLKGAVFSIDHKLPRADSLIYATAYLENAVVWTQDADFQGLPGVKYIEKTAL